MPNRRYKEVRVRTGIDSGELIAMLDECGCEGASESGDHLSLYWAEDRWHQESLEALKEALRALGDAEAEATIELADIPDQDWNAVWAASLHPIHLGSRILVRQSWNEAPVPEHGFELIVDPKRAFGTGYHATTQLLAEWLPELIRGGERVLDIGTGSGILAMIALRLGAAYALGVDNDPEAIECATENAAVNAFGAELELRVAGLEDLTAGEFGVVLANLDRRALLPNFGLLHRFVGPDCRVLVSGLLQADDDEVRSALATAAWHVAERRDRDEWMALELRKNTFLG